MKDKNPPSYIELILHCVTICKLEFTKITFIRERHLTSHQIVGPFRFDNLFVSFLSQTRHRASCATFQYIAFNVLINQVRIA